MKYGNQSLVVVANRLPVDRCEGSWSPSPGGLVSAVAPMVKESRGAWIGWCGTSDEEFEPFEFDGMHLVPIALGSDEYDKYYEGFSNATLWPLYHDLVVPPQFHRSWWKTYLSTNARFAQAAVDAAAHEATIWIHDFHLQLVPEMIRAQRPDVRIGFFNHIPFPSESIFAQLPWRDSILRGLLGADVIGFQLDSDVENFRSAVSRFLGISSEELPNTVRAYPISIDADAIHRVAEAEETQHRARQMREELDDPRCLIVGVDRLDYTKGILHRLRAYHELLEDGVLDPQETTFVQVAVPSREGLESYQDLRDEVEQLVGNINGSFGAMDRAAVHYFHHSYSFESTVALYLAADVLLVTSLRDGMNLVAKEYVAARHDSGALVLSEFAGAAAELDEALLVNPHDIAGLKDAIRLGAEMPPAEAQRRMASMAEVVDGHDIHRWARAFLDDLRPMPPTRAPTTAESTNQPINADPNQRTQYVHTAQ
ncbi:trehalose 6-phosphate synthase [Brevibacterium marinum]|uniref:Trehalose 6-phosphate synthase n=1 Tax=Brevibacterium marinum TaxID=418643 RepID=A0A846S4R9_9MICO|nr:trehalose 6-phosphate synthase [Brevibacterium marinum]